MPKPSWEAANNNDFFGYLKFLDFQTNGYDIHVTFQKDKKVHVSMYKLEGKNGKKVCDSIWMDIRPMGLELNFMEWWAIKGLVNSGNPFPTVAGYKDYEQFFHEESSSKAVELGIIEAKPGVGPTQKKIALDSGWPALG